MKKSKQTKTNDIFSSLKYKCFLLLLLTGLCFALAGNIITTYFRNQEPDANEVLQDYLSGSFASNINNLYIYDVDKLMEDFMDSSAVTSFFFCSEKYPAAGELISYLENNLSNIAERSDYITAVAIYASTSNTYVSSKTDKMSESKLNSILKNMIYNYNSNSVDKNSLNSEGFNTFLFKYEDYVVFSKNLTTLSGSSYSTMFLLMDADAFSAFVYRANGSLPYKVSIYDAHNTLLYSNSSRTAKANYSQLLNFTTKEGNSNTEQAENSSYIYCKSDVTGLQYLLEMENLPLPGKTKTTPLIYLSVVIAALLLALLVFLIFQKLMEKTIRQIRTISKKIELQSPFSVEKLTTQVNQKLSSLLDESTTMSNIIAATSAEAASHLFARIISGESIDSNEAQLTLRNTNYGFQLEDIYIAGILHQKIPESVPASGRYRILNMLNSIFDRFKEKNNCNLCAFMFDEKSFIIIASFPAGTSIAKGKSRINDLTQQINEGISLMNLPMAVAFGHMYNSIQDLVFSYNEAFKTMHYQVESGGTGFTYNQSSPYIFPSDVVADLKEPSYSNLNADEVLPDPSLQANNLQDNLNAAQNSSEYSIQETVANIDTFDAPAATEVSEISNPPQSDTFERIERRAAQIAQLIWDNKEDGLPSLITRTLNNIFEEKELTSQEELSRRLISAVTSHMISYPFVNDSHLSNVYDDLSLTIQNGVSSEKLRESLLAALSILCQDFSEALKRQRNPYITAAQEYIEQNYSNPDLSLEEIAESLKIAPNYLSTIFSKNLGIKLFEYVNEYRLEKSIELLLHTDKTVNDISTECGFGSSRNYIRIFKKYKDNTPGAYRKQHVMKNEIH